MLALLVLFAGESTQVSLKELVKGSHWGWKLLKEFFPPELSCIGELLVSAAVTVSMALLATPLGAVVSLIFGLLAAKNTSVPGIRMLARLTISLERALPEIVILLFLAAALGLGLYPGILALAIGSIGMLGRLLADAIEDIDERILESITTVGAKRSQIIRYAVLPEVLPSFIANSVFRFEINIRNSVLLGAVGVGGIGYELNEAISLMNYERATTTIIIIILLVIASERLSDYARRKVLAQGEKL